MYAQWTCYTGILFHINGLHVLYEILYSCTLSWLMKSLTLKCQKVNGNFWHSQCNPPFQNPAYGPVHACETTWWQAYMQCPLHGTDGSSKRKSTKKRCTILVDTREPATSHAVLYMCSETATGWWNWPKNSQRTQTIEITHRCPGGDLDGHFHR